MSQHVYLVGAKGVSFYGGYESFVQKLLEYHKNNINIQYHVACKANGDGSMDISQLEGASSVKNNRFVYCNADCFFVQVPEWLGPAQAIVYDVKALKECCNHIEKNRIEHAIVYILACRIGPFVKKYIKQIHQMGGKVYLNPDGHEWKRTKWSALVRKYWKESERLMVKYADLIICDSMNIQKYIHAEYRQYDPATTYIAYGAETQKSTLNDNDPQYAAWLKKHGIENYYTMISRCVPENNYETIIREFMKSHTPKSLVIISTNNEKFMNELEKKLHYKNDDRIKFVGTVYDTELLTKIRENSYGYLHGHSVGGTNPSLLEALGATKLNLLFDIGFNREVAEEAALYWNTEMGNLAALIDQVEEMSEKERDRLGTKAKNRIKKMYSWQLITDMYLDRFLNTCLSNRI
jgi:rhamnosyltransferase